MSAFSRLFAIACLAALLTARPAWAALQDQIDSMFSSMSNVTNPTAVMDQRRGLLAGGQYSMRSHVMDVQVLNALPPSAAAGCNGIDLFGGSFSFISKDQFIQLLRSIAANASGYAFKMALQAMCPSCDAAMSNLQGLIQKLNRLSVNSCEAGKQLVNTAVAATPAVLKNAVDGSANSIARATGAATDALSSLFPAANDGVSSIGELAKTSGGRQALQDQQVIGNVVWSALKKANAGSWWQDGDQQFEEAIMSVTGTIIAHPPASGSNNPPSFATLPPILGIADLMKGSTDAAVPVYRCLSAECYSPGNTSGEVTDPVVTTMPLSSFSEQVSSMVNSLVQKFATNQPLTDREQAFMASAPAAVGGIVRNLAQNSVGMASLYANQAGPVIAQMMAANLVLSMIRTVKVAMAQSNAPDAVQMRARLRQVADDARGEAAQIHNGLASLAQTVGTYKDLMQVTEKRRLNLQDVMAQNRILPHAQR